jgi:hypothetical protein
MPTEANPEPEPTFPRLMNPSLPINTVRKLLEEAKSLFDNIVYYWDQLLFKRSFRQRLRDAWGELRDILANLATELSDNMTETVQNGLRRIGFDGN